MEFFGLTAAEAIVVVLAALAGGAIRGFTGFGSALVIAPILSIAVGSRIAVPAIILVLFVSTFQLLPGAARDVNWRRVLQLGLAGAVGAPIGVYGLIYIDQELMRRFIAVVVVAFAVAMLAGWRYQREPSPYLAIGVGGVGGVLSGAASVGGPPVILFLLAGPGAAAANRAAIIYYFFFSQIVVLGMYWFEGVMVMKVLWLAVLMLPAQMIGVAIGTKLFPKANETLYRRVALGVLLTIGLITLVI
jgi:uncharacterized protein